MLAIGTEVAGRYLVTAVIDPAADAALYRVTVRDGDERCLLAAVALPDAAAADTAAAQLRQLRQAALPGILPISEVWVDGATCCVVCSEGAGDLQDLLARRPLPFSETTALVLVRRLLEILVPLHDLVPPLLLGDLRATDVWFDGEEQPLLLPSLLIRPVSGRPAEFSAPELRATNQEPSCTADIYAVGALLYLLLSGRRATLPLQPLRGLRSDLSALTEPLVLRALDERPANRYQQAREMLSAVRTVELLTGEREPAEPVETPLPTPSVVPSVPAPTPSQRAPRRLSNGCLIGIVLAILLAAVTLCGVLVLIGYLLLSPNGPLAGQVSLPNLPIAAAVATDDLADLRAAADEYVVTADQRDAALGPTEYAPDGQVIAVAVGREVQLRDVASFSLRTTLSGSAGDVSALSFSADSALIAVGAQDDAVIRIYAVSDGSLQHELRGHEGWIRSLAFAADGRLASGGSDFSVRVWDVDAGQQLQQFSGHTDMVGQIAFAPDSEELASVSRDGTVRLWSLDDGSSRVRFTAPPGEDGASPAWLTGLSWHPDGQRIAIGSVNGMIYLLNPADDADPQVLSGHSGWVVIRGLSFSRDGRLLASASLDGELRLWSANDGSAIGTLREQGFRLLGLSWLPDGTQIATSTDVGGRLVVWDVVQQMELGHAQISQGVVTALAAAPDNSGFLSAGLGGLMRAHDADGVADAQLRGVAPVHQAVAYLDRNLIAVVGDDGSVGLFDLTEQQPPQTLPLTDAERAVSIAADQGRGVLAVGLQSGEVQLWQRTDLTMLSRTQIFTTPVYALAFSVDGMQLAAVTNETAGAPQILLWRYTSEEDPLVITGHTAPVTGMTFAPDGTALMSTSSDGTLRQWATADGRQLAMITADPTRGWFSEIGLLPERALLVVGTAGGQLAFYRLTDLTLVREMEPGQGAVLALAVSQDGGSLMVSTDDGALLLIRDKTP